MDRGSVNGSAQLRILLVSPYPPAPDSLARRALHEVHGLRAAGHDIEVLSPAPSAARHHLDFLSSRAPLALARRVGSYDRVVIELEPGLLSRAPEKPSERVRAALGLRLVLARCRQAELRLRGYDDAVTGDAMPARLTRAALRAADTIVVDDAMQRERLVALLGVPDARVRVRPDTAPVESCHAPLSPPGSRPWRIADDAGSEEIMAEIRARAALRRQAEPQRSDASAALRRVPPLAFAVPVSARPAASLLKRIVRRLTAWQLDPLVTQMNRLRDATIHALEQRPAPDEHR